MTAGISCKKSYVSFIYALGFLDLSLERKEHSNVRQNVGNSIIANREKTVTNTVDYKDYDYRL